MNKSKLLLATTPIIISLILANTLLSACATITTGERQSLEIETKNKEGKMIQNCQCELINDKGKWSLSTPNSVLVHKSSKEIKISCKKEGYQTSELKIKSHTGPAMMANMIIPGGSIGALIDHSRGSAYLYPKLVQVIMEPVSQENA